MRLPAPILEHPIECVVAGLLLAAFFLAGFFRLRPAAFLGGGMGGRPLVFGFSSVP